MSSHPDESDSNSFGGIDEMSGLSTPPASPKTDDSEPQHPVASRPHSINRKKSVGPSKLLHRTKNARVTKSSDAAAVRTRSMPNRRDYDLCPIRPTDSRYGANLKDHEKRCQFPNNDEAAVAETQYATGFHIQPASPTSGLTWAPNLSFAQSSPAIGEPASVAPETVNEYSYLGVLEKSPMYVWSNEVFNNRLWLEQAFPVTNFASLEAHESYLNLTHGQSDHLQTHPTRGHEFVLYSILQVLNRCQTELEMLRAFLRPVASTHSDWLHPPGLSDRKW